MRVAGRLLPLASADAAASQRISARARGWVEAVRARQAGSAGIESFLQQYDLSTQEGVLLMCVAEALLRIPDAETADRLIRDKLSRGDWRHLGQSPRRWSTRPGGWMLTGADADRRQRSAIRRAGTSASSRARANRSCEWRYGRRCG
jgi:RHH-type proline utilization regulon transcriptional repressor/proline dehydrogenase/delta 1-pyrroline-5-carboxylate dehydrogenase